MNLINSLHEKHFALATTLGYLMDLREIGKGIDMLERINFTDTRRLRAWYHLSDGDESAAESIVDSLHAEDSTAHKEFRKFILFSKDFTAQEVPCETPTAQVSWLKSIANTDNEMAFAAEATLTAIDDKQLTPTPLRWVEPDAKRGGQVEKYEEATQQKVWIYPVPAQNQVKVVNNHGPGIFALYDTYGRQLALINLESGTSDIPIAHIPAGYYIAMLYSLNNQTQRSPLIIVR